ncbi:cell division control protein 42 homolog isoform X2 [Mya arenaria]|uniref:cell division control protein 42 homolog isoform X2 n=1 Tax=Mya arenaria TaxID=6604 RepID=UPI0022E869B8|nr:cell division control protein 42 homolog isoform X2 [Mya arenaria]
MQLSILIRNEITVAVRGTSYQLGLFDTAGQEEYENLRILSYPETQIFLMAYSVVMPDTMRNLETKWLPEVKTKYPTAAFIVVGTQIDLREDEKIRQKLQKRKQKPVTPEEGARLAKRVNADCYVECSALTQQGLKDVFDKAILAVIEPKIKRTAPRKTHKCAIL